MDLAHEVLKAGIGTEALEAWFVGKINDVVAAVIKRLLHPPESLIVVAETYTNRHHADGGNVLLLRETHQLGQQLSRLLALSGNSIGVA